MKKEYVTNLALYNEWLTDVDYTGKLEEDTARRWINRKVSELIDTEQLSFAVALLDINGFIGVMPKGFHSAYLVAGVDDYQKCWNREQLVGYTQDIYGTDCVLDVHIKCPSCSKSSCECSTAIIEVDVDDSYLQERPYLWVPKNNKYLGYSAATTDGFPCADFCPDFKIMKPRVTEMALWNSEFFLGECKGLNLNGCYTYDIEPPLFKTDMRKGQVYMSYLRYKLDEDGYYTIPKFPEVIEAITYYMSWKMAERSWMKDGNQNDRLRWLDAKNMCEQKTVEARTLLEIPSADKILSLGKSHWKQGPERFYYK